MPAADGYARELEVARAAAKAAGELLIELQSETLTIDFKGHSDLVTNADRASEQLIAEMILDAFPGDAMLAEESGHIAPAAPSERVWVVDPLDGTTNYAHGIPLYAVSIALVDRGEVVVAVVDVPPLRECFEATLGGGAKLNGQPIRCSSTDKLADALLATGFPYDVEERAASLHHWERFTLASRAVRRIGSAAYDLCCVAAGRFDGYWERGPSAWDLAAGSLLVAEAGGIVSAYDTGPFDMHAREVLAAAPGLHREMAAVLAE
ncbi:MAG TPA: inositol monophosphatase family protein [Thermomicrobiales bacterium]|nr:inositol monophosphatase family protein [Thermomicrobiales bacterium]